MAHPRRILIASYYFPPDAAVGGLRAAKFARFLPEFGWEPYVITARDEYRDQGLDLSRLHGLEDIRIRRTRQLPSFRTVYLAVRRRLGWTATIARRDASAVIPNHAPAASTPEQLTARLKRYVASLIVFFPDTKKEWAMWAAFEAIGIIRKYRIDTILTSTPPFSAHLIGLVAKMVTGATWIADFRDPWVEMLPERNPLSRTRLSDALESRMEALVMKHADRVLTTTERLRRSLVARYPTLPEAKFVYLPNSIDTERLRSFERVEKYGPLTITYAGTLYFDRTPEPLFRAVGDLVRAGRISESDIRIKLLGNCDTVNGKETRQIAREYGIERLVEVLKPVPYSEAIEIMGRSHLLLTIAPARHELVVGAKLFDYLGCGSKILGLAESGATSDLIAETNSGRCFSNHDIAGLREYLYGLIANKATVDFSNDTGSFRQFHVKHLTGRLAAEATDVRAKALEARALRAV